MVTFTRSVVSWVSPCVTWIMFSHRWFRFIVKGVGWGSGPSIIKGWLDSQAAAPVEKPSALRCVDRLVPCWYPVNLRVKGGEVSAASIASCAVDLTRKSAKLLINISLTLSLLHQPSNNDMSSAAPPVRYKPPSCVWHDAVLHVNISMLAALALSSPFVLHRLASWNCLANDVCWQSSL